MVINSIALFALFAFMVALAAWIGWKLLGWCSERVLQWVTIGAGVMSVMIAILAISDLVRLQSISSRIESIESAQRKMTPKQQQPPQQPPLPQPESKTDGPNDVYQPERASSAYALPPLPSLTPRVYPSPYVQPNASNQDSENTSILPQVVP